jgi:hypothetical protein
MSPYILPTFKGYTVDFRLKQFRLAIPHEVLEFIEFDSEEGQALFSEMSGFFCKELGLTAVLVGFGEENSVLRDLLEAALKRLTAISSEAGNEATGIEMTLDELLKEI